MTEQQSAERKEIASAPRKKPTRKHKPLMWYGLFGTRYASADGAEGKYFDYLVEDAAKHAMLNKPTDLRWYPAQHPMTVGRMEIMKGQMVCWGVIA